LLIHSFLHEVIVTDIPTKAEETTPREESETAPVAPNKELTELKKNG